MFPDFSVSAVYDNQGEMTNGTEVKRFLLEVSNPVHSIKVFPERYCFFLIKVTVSAGASFKDLICSGKMQQYQQYIRSCI